MTDGAMANIRVQRNEDWVRQFNLSGDGQRLDLAGWEFSLRVHSENGLTTTPLIQAGEFPTANRTSIRMLRPSTDGAFEVVISAEELSALPGRAQDVARYPYNIICTDENKLRRAELRGYLIVEPSVSSASGMLLITEDEVFLMTETGEYLGY